MANLDFALVIVLNNYVQRMNFLIFECNVDLECIEADIYLEDEDGDEGYYWEDDVDETNYDPYMGCDFYDCDDCWE